MMKKTFLSIEQIYESGKYDFKNIFEHLEVLNQILANTLPSSLVKFCHIGAFDKATVVLFVSNQSVLHLLNNQTNNILKAFYNANYTFDNLLVKLRIRNSSESKEEAQAITL